MTGSIRRILKRIYLFLFKPFLKKGVYVNIGSAGRYRFDYAFLFSGFEKFGIKHNSGFSIWLKACSGKKCVLDIGAHIGLYSIPAGRVLGENGHIYAIEPSDANRGYLLKHAEMNKLNNIRAYPFVAGSIPLDESDFFESTFANAMNSVAPRKNPHIYKKVKKRQISIDMFCIERGLNPEIIKIDVEGAELDVLKGAREVLLKNDPVIFLSIHPATLFNRGESPDDIRSLLKMLGYVIYTVDGIKPEVFRHNEYIVLSKARNVNEII